MQLVITYGTALYINDSIYRQNTNIEKNLCICERTERASSENFCKHKLLFLSIFCWYFRYFVGTNDMLVGLHVATNFQMYRKNSEKALWGGGGDCSLPPPPPRYANGWQCQGIPYIIWPGSCARSARQI